MNVAECIALMEHHGEVLRQLASGVSDEQMRWKPAPDSWSMLEVVNHLCDEERDDFRTRLKHILDQAPGLPLDIHPDDWVTLRQYNQQDPAESLARFLQEREASLAWLRTLGEPDLDVSNELPSGPQRAGDMLLSWVAHDILHLRQLVELRYAWLEQQAKPYKLRYAGEWIPEE